MSLKNTHCHSEMRRYNNNAISIFKIDRIHYRGINCTAVCRPAEEVTPNPHFDIANCKLGALYQQGSTLFKYSILYG